MKKYFYNFKNYDVIIVGAGIIGLSTCYTLLKKYNGLKIAIIEKEKDISLHQTGNNSGVIHSGIYYKPGSLKAKNCRKGYQMLINFCNENEIKYEICGKIIVATDESELESLNKIYERGTQNGLDNLKILSNNEIKSIEPFATGVRGIFVPQTGIIDFKEVSRKISELINDIGGEIILNEKVIDIKRIQAGKEISVFTNKNSYKTKFLITCAGLYSDKIAKITNPELTIKIIPFRGEYYLIKKENHHFVRNLIYPVPDTRFPFLGVHFTRTLKGDREAGPNAVFSFKREGYNKFDFDLKDMFDSIFWSGFYNMSKKYWKIGFMEFYRSFSKNAFVKSLKKLIPAIEINNLIPGPAGVRAQAVDSEGNLIDDFLFVENENILHVCNAPSPAATSCLAIAETISEKVLL
ncbi:MAG: L-2-hydroxyglutarate oxidase [Ignavibacteria bacterium]|nr:L-2-hydroxyglutarate oxidase [Ignavibacteria bacterium]